MNITGAFALILGAIFSTYVFMPKRRVLAYSLDPNQPGDEFLFNLLIAPFAIIVNLVASLPGAVRALLAGKLHSRVPATILIAIGAFVATLGDTLNRFGMTEWFQLGKFLGVLFLFAGFLVSIEVFREIRVPFTSIRLGRTRHEPAGAEQLAAASETAGDHADRGARAELTGTAARDGRRPYHGAHACPVRPARSGRPSPGSPSSSLARVAVRDARAAVALRLRRRDGADSRSSPGAAPSGLIAAAVFVAWRISARPRAADPARRPRPAAPGSAWRSRRCAGFLLNLAMFIAFDLVTVALALLGFYTYPVIVGRRQRRARARSARPAAGRRPRPGRGRDGRGRRLAARPGGGDPARCRRVRPGPRAAGCQAIFVIISRTGYRPVPAVQAMSVVLATTVVCSLVLALATGAGEALAYPLRDPSVLPLLVFTGLFAAAIPSILFLTGIRLVGGTRAGILMLFEPVVGVALAAWLLDEGLAPIQVVGGLAILAAALILQRRPPRASGRSSRRRSNPTP